MKEGLKVWLSITTFVLSWLLYYVLADRNNFRAIAPTCYFAVVLGLTTDLLIGDYPLWHYPASSQLMVHMKDLLNDFGIYFVVTYLFLQMLPSKRTFKTMAFYVFLWTICTTLLEGLYLALGNMKYGLWWNIGYSYLADWFLFIVFYLHYKWHLDKRLIGH